ncbi:hypothetical protein [Rhizobium sp. SAFR-030]|uniref:hypothetical protein n=1 Tax=Rhizobium sp. SAFR-030 TaxID=3387277 RepID=UPI003F81F3C3
MIYSPPAGSSSESDLLLEVQRLRHEVALLSSMIDRATPVEARIRADRHPWLRLAATIGMSFALGKVIRVLRLPGATAAAIPLITSQVSNRFL